MSNFLKQLVCEHEWEEVKEGGHNWEMITYRLCKKCGKKEEVDREKYQD